MTDKKQLTPVEYAKLKSQGLRGTLEESIANRVTGALATDDQHLIKFHGIYQQDDRDRRAERADKKLEPAYSFMIRLRMPGGDCSAQQWLGIQTIADVYGTGVVKITTRQTVQIHGVVKAQLKPTLKDFAALGLDSIAACGDVNRNVIAGSFPAIAPWHAEVHQYAKSISEHLLPKTKGYYEIFLDGENLTPETIETDPLYQDRYLPRKFKIAIAIPPHNDTDVYAHDIGLIAVEEQGKFVGFNLLVGGGMGMTHGNEKTYPRIASELGFITPEQVLESCYQIVALQRDFGDRTDRKQARLKYTIDKMSLDKFKTVLEDRLSFKFAPVKAVKFNKRGDQYGWVQDHTGKWHYTLFVENGRVVDNHNGDLNSFLKEYAQLNLGELRVTANQNVILLNISEENKKIVEQLLIKAEVVLEILPIRADAIACVALPTCPLALAEAQRYLPELVTKIELLLTKHCLENENISIRMTGCPNGCARPYLAEIGLIGTRADHYNLQLGGDALGMRLNKLYKQDLSEKEILNVLDQLFAQFATERRQQEPFGDFVQRILQ